MAEIAPMNDQQRRMLVDTRQLWEAWRDAGARRVHHAGALSWKTTKGRAYLVKAYNDPRTHVRKMTSLGPRSDETERMKAAFDQGRAEAKERFAAMSARLAEQGRLNRAVGLGRVPPIAARVLRRLDGEGLLGRNCLVAGTNAIYAYEAAAGVMVGRGLLATGDLDILLDARARLRLTLEGAVPGRIVDVLKAADRSFQLADNAPFRAVNADGYAVELIKAAPTPHWKAEPAGLAEDDLRAAEIDNIRWLLNAPRFDSVAIGEDGMPVPMAVPDPRAFAVYKLWMGLKDPARDPVKRPRDVGQAHLVAQIVRAYLPHLPFAEEHLLMFPEDVRAFATAHGLTGLPPPPDVPDPFFTA